MQTRRDFLMGAASLATMIAARDTALGAQTNTGARVNGNTISFADCAIAAIARTHGFTVATRNVRDFRGTGVEVINPWTFTRK